MATSELRFRDCPTTTAEVVIAAPPETVWPLVADITTPTRFSEELAETHWLDGARTPTAGARFTGRNVNPRIGTWETTCTVVEWEPNRVFGWVVEDPAFPSATWRYELEPAEGGTRLRHFAQLGPGPSGLSEAIEKHPEHEGRIVSWRIADLNRNMLATLHGIKDLAEQ